MIPKNLLEKLYLENRASMMEISRELNCSVHKVAYWMDIHEVKRRSIGEAIYQKHNPKGDPFVAKAIITKADAELLGLGLGLYWGEGTKSNKHSIRLGNTDPELLKSFMAFLVQLFGVKKEDIRFGLQIFTDINSEEALNFWVTALGVNPSQFYKITVTISGSLGTYRRKSKYGVVTLYYHNKKLRDIINSMLPR